MKVAILGATGETGSSIVNGLLASESPKYQVTALVRPSSLEKPELSALGARGVKVVSIDLSGPEEDLVSSLKDIDTIVSCIGAPQLLSQIPLINAAKAADVKRFVPCHFATIAPPKGILRLRDTKEDVLNHVKKSNVPFTVIDVGWWYQLALPKLPSGRIDYALVGMPNLIAGDGNVPSAMTDTRDIGPYVARIIADPRTINKMVFAYSELLAQKEIYEMLEMLSGETIERNYVSIQDVLAGLADAEADSSATTVGSPAYYKLSKLQYWHSWGIRGDNTPKYAKYLGYLDAKELYPDMKGITFEAYCKEVLDGSARRAYSKAEQPAS